MTFNSLQFLVFFMIVTLWFFSLKSQQGRIILLLITSCYFYMSFIPEYLIILGGIIVVDYFAGIQIERNEGSTRKLWLTLSVIANVGTLCVFKYYNFLIGNLHDGASFFGIHLSLPVLEMALPLGLSFHTFQALSYTIEVYRENQKAEKNFPVYALYVMFYPQLVAGPIERPQNVLPQIKEFRPYNWDNVKEGLARMLWGFYKKVVIADRLAMIVDRTYSHTSESSSVALFAGAMFYFFQIYCDFSGYSDIALGAAQVMNIRLMENFNQPFFSKSISEFWRRWHISLYSWFYDYVFNPLFFSLRNLGNLAIILCLLVTFSLSGLWHGATWHHIIYGLLMAVALIYEYFTKEWRRKLFSKLPVGLNSAISTTFTICFVVFAGVFFRSVTARGACTYIRKILDFKGGSNYVGVDRNELIFAVVTIVIMLWKERRLPGNLIKNDGKFYLFTAAMVLICYYFGVFAENQFIYFQF